MKNILPSCAGVGVLALFQDSTNIERTDRLVQTIAAQYGMHNSIVDQTVATVDAQLAVNRKAAAA